MKVLVVGGGKLAYFLVRTLISKGAHVTIINRELHECKSLARKLKATIVHGDGSDPQILEEAGASNVDTLFAITPNDEDNLVICQLADIQFHVQRRLALVNDPDNEEIFQKPPAASTETIIKNMILFFNIKLMMSGINQFQPSFHICYSDAFGVIGRSAGGTYRILCLKMND